MTDHSKIGVRTSPQVGLVLLTGILVMAAVLGRLWTASLVGVAAVAAFFGWTSPRVSRRLGVVLLMISQFLAVILWLNPTDNNFYAYAVGFLILVSLAGSARIGLRLDWMLVFLGWLLLSAMVSTVSLHASPVYGLMVVPLGLLGVYLSLTASDRDDREFYVRALLWFAGVQAALGIAQSAFGVAPFTALGAVTYTDARNYLAVVIPALSTTVRMGTGTFEHFNTLGALMALTTPIAFSRWLRLKSVRSFALLVLVVGGLVSTFSRGALLGSVVACLLIYLSDRREGMRQGLRVVGMSLMAALSTLVASNAISSYAAATSNVGSRLGAWNVALNATMSNPARLLFGAGYGYYGSGFLAEQGAISRLHSAPIQILSELGLVGCALIVVAVYPVIRRGFRSGSPGQIAMSGAAVAFLVHQLVDNGLFALPGILFLGLIAALAAAQRQCDIPDAGSESRTRTSPHE